MISSLTKLQRVTIEHVPMREYGDSTLGVELRHVWPAALICPTRFVKQTKEYERLACLSMPAMAAIRHFIHPFQLPTPVRAADAEKVDAAPR